MTGPAGASAVRGHLAHRRRVRIAFSLLAIAIVLVIGTIGLYGLTGSGWIDSFYFECMLATGQGPPFSLASDAAKLFASLMAFVSIGTVLSTLVVNLAPIFGRFWREGIEEAERDIQRLERDVSGEIHRREPP
jgi:hypothetical protein